MKKMTSLGTWGHYPIVLGILAVAMDLPSPGSFTMQSLPHVLSCPRQIAHCLAPSHSVELTRSEDVADTPMPATPLA